MNAPVTSAPGMNKQWVERRAKAVSRGVGMGAPSWRHGPRIPKSGMSKATATSISAAVSRCVNTGHRHPAVMKRVYEQLEKLTHTCSTVMPYAPFVELCEKLNAVAPISGEKK